MPPSIILCSEFSRGKARRAKSPFRELGELSIDICRAGWVVLRSTFILRIVLHCIYLLPKWSQVDPFSPQPSNTPRSSC